MKPTYSGTILIKNSKIESIDLKSPEKELLEIEKIIALKNIVDNFIIQYEKEFKRY